MAVYLLLGYPEDPCCLSVRAAWRSLVTNVEEEARAFGRHLAREAMAVTDYGPLTSEARYLVAKIHLGYTRHPGPDARPGLDSSGIHRPLVGWPSTSVLVRKVGEILL